ncbi:SRPBCC family protein [Halosimplex sp. J119]
MRAAALSRTVSAPPKTVAYRLTPERVVEAEGEFQVLDVSAEDGRTVVTVWPNGRILAPRFVFEDRPDGFVYRRIPEGDPLLRAETTVAFTPDGDGTRVDVQADVTTRVPLPFVERLAARRRRRAVRRFVDRLDALVA